MQMARVETICRFAHGSVVASFIDDTTLRCRSPPALSAGIALLRDRSVNTVQSILPLTGRRSLPALSSGILTLVEPPNWRSVQPSSSLRDSAWNVIPADPAALRDFMVSFAVNITARPVDGGESISFCAGRDLATPLRAARAWVDGFCVTYTQSLSASVILEERGTLLASVGVPDRGMRWQRLVVTLADQRVSITHDGAAILNGTALSEWRPTADFQMGFTSRRPTVFHHSHEWLSHVRVMSGSLVRAIDAPVEVSLNSQEFSSDGVPFTYLAEPHVRTIFPVAGPVQGGTYVALSVHVPLAVENATEIRCQFNGSSTNATWDAEARQILCQTPEMAAPGRVEATIEMVLDNYTLNSGDGVPYTFYEAPVLARVWPHAGPTSGHTDIAIAGSGFAAGIGPFSCRFNSVDVQPATVELRSRTMHCQTPPSGAATALVEVTLNGQQYHSGPSDSPSDFLFYTQPQILSISPSSGTIRGQTAVTIAGSGFLEAFNTLCRWGNLTTNVSELNSTHLMCPTPQTPPGISPVEVTLNGQQYTSDGANFSHYLHPHAHKLSVQGEIGNPGTWVEEKITLPQAGYIMVDIWGSGFMGGTDYRCKINENDAIPATYDAGSDRIRCWSDMWVDGTNFVEVTLNGREYTMDNLSLPINQFWFDERYNSPEASPS
jgi:hypothetical protein